jgi:hypothetical protein
MRAGDDFRAAATHQFPALCCLMLHEQVSDVAPDVEGSGHSLFSSLSWLDWGLAPVNMGSERRVFECRGNS